MFTGLIQTVGIVRSFSEGVLLVDFDPSWTDGDPLVVGESIACNGCCLTQVPCDQGLKFELSPETIARTAFNRLAPGSKINLERAMKPTDRFGGHIVQGHVDKVGKVVSIQPQADHFEFKFQIPASDDRYLIDKGSICIDGISLTVVSPAAGEFNVWVVPHTFANTTLGTIQPGDPVNIEYDVIAKHLEKLVSRV